MLSFQKRIEIGWKSWPQSTNHENFAEYWAV